MKFVIICKFLIFLGIINLFSHNTIKGTIKDSLNKPIAGATIRLDNTTIGAIAGKNREFSLRRIPAGVYTMRVTAVGYQPFVKEYDLSRKEDYTEEVVIILRESGVMSSELVVTATRTDKLYEDVPVKVSVIDNKIFEATQNASIQEGIRFAPGLRVEANCQNCGYSQIRLNGLEGRYSQILIDGRPIFSALNSLYGLDQIPANMIERIEVIRGGGSAIYGGNAIAGVVNIITKMPVENSFEGKYTYGLINGKTPDYSYQINGASLSENQDIGFYIFGNYNKRETFDANNDGFSEIPFITGTSFGARAFYSPNIKSKFTFDFQSLNDYRRGGDSIELPPHEVMMAEDMTHNLNAGGITYETFFNNDLSKLSIYTSFNITNKKNYTGTDKDPNGYGKTDSKIYVAGFQYAHTINNNFLGSAILTVGGEFQDENVVNEATGYRSSLNQEVQVYGFYSQFDWFINNNFNLITGLRLDKHNFINNLIINPRISLMYKNEDLFTLRTTFSTGYRAPQAFDEDLHAELRAGKRTIVELADNLKEEKSYSFSAGLDKYFKIGDLPFSFSGEFFYTKLNDMFVNQEEGIDERGNIVYLKKNTSGATVTGTTLELRTSFSLYYQLQAGFTYQKSKYDEPHIWSIGLDGNNIQTTYEILRSPNTYGYLTAYINPFDNVEFSLSMIYTGQMKLPHFAGGILPDGTINENDLLRTTKDFVELNISATYYFKNKPEFALTFGINNILNQYQNDFDRGPNRDSNYIYGPLKPTTYRIGIMAKI
jgi:outer membrane receptor for ferrienterochelin and colicins